MSPEHQGADRCLRQRSFELAIVVATDEQRVIGRDGDLPWRLPADLRHFKELTMGHPIIMGRKTFESIGKPLPGRHNIVLSRRKDFDAGAATVVSSIEEACQCVEQSGARRAFVIGGESLFRRLLPEVERLYLTVVRGSYGGDTFFPAFDGDQWEVVDSRSRSADEENEADMLFVEFEAAAGPPRRVDASRGGGALPDIVLELMD